MLRCRLLNVAASRPYNLKLKALNTATNRLEDVHNSRCWIIAADGGYRNESVRWPAAGLVMGAGERYEVGALFWSFKNPVNLPPAGQLGIRGGCSSGPQPASLQAGAQRRCALPPTDAGHLQL